MDKKTEEMIALGVAYGINCMACMEYHNKQALEVGLTKEQMQAAIQIAEQVKAGAAKKTKDSPSSFLAIFRTNHAVLREVNAAPKTAECMKKCGWFPLIPVVFGVVLSLLGYYF